jgi:hypothetical protein
MKSFKSASLLGIIACLCTVAVAADEAAKQDEMITKVYWVADLIFSAPNYPFEGINTAGAFGSGEKLPGTGVSAGGVPMHGAFGGGGFGGGGGGFSMPDTAASAKPVTSAGKPATTTEGNINNAGMVGPPSALDDLVQVIEGSVNPESWNDMGGHGTITEFGGRLIISQTREIHAEIEKLLTALRADGGAHGTVTVRAWWLRLDSAQYQKLIAEMPAVSPPLVNRKQLEALAADRGADYGQVTCFDGQTVHIISGRFRNAVTSVIPVVGQIEPQRRPDAMETALAAIDAPETDRIIGDLVRHDHSMGKSLHGIELAANDSSASGSDKPVPSEGIVGYEPVVSKQHAGALLELTPTRLPHERAVILDLRSLVTHWSAQPEPPVQFRNIVPLDRTSVLSQQIATTLKVPLKQPVLVGGLSLEPGSAAEADAKLQLYLVVEAIDETK